MAHPAAVLPLRRYCPRYLSFPALVVGSLSPDFGYIFGHRHVDWFSHRFFAGSFGFCLPVGLLVLLVFYAVRKPVIGILPARFRQVLLPLCLQPSGPLLGVVLSLVIGAWTHLFLDSIIEEHGWLGMYPSILENSVALMGNHSIKVCELLYAGCTFGGVAWLAVCYLQWLERAAGSPGRIGRGLKWGCAFLLAALILFIAMSNRGDHHWLHSTPLELAIALLLVIVFVVGTAMLVAANEREDLNAAKSQPAKSEDGK